MEISSYDKSHTYNLWLSLIKYVAVVAIAVGVGWGIKKIQGNTYLSNIDVQLRTSEHRSMYSYVRLSHRSSTATYV